MIKLSSGKEFECNYVTQIQNPHRLYVRVTNSTVGEVAASFANPVETASMEFEGERIDGFTRFVAISAEGDAIRVSLAKKEE